MATGVAAMRQVGSKRERPLSVSAGGVLLAEGARFNEAIARLSQTTVVPKGIYRFRSHDAANRHAEECLVRGMGRLAATRSPLMVINVRRLISMWLSRRHRKICKPHNRLQR
jgi:hypothetical protein